MKSLIEGLLDDNIFNDVEGAIATDWLKDNVKSKYKVMQLKTGELKVWGKLVIKKVDQFGYLNISLLDGDLYIENCNVTSLDNIFSTNHPKVTGNIYITGCPKLVDISGLPMWVDGEVSISNCPALKSLDGVECHAGDVTIMTCGKKFSKSAIERAFVCAINVHCSEKEYIANLLEAFQDPILTRVFDQLKNQKSTFNISEIFTGGIALNKITPSMRTTYRYMDNVKKIQTAVRKICANKGGIQGFIITEDWDGNFVEAYNQNQRCYYLKHGTRKDNEQWYSGKGNNGEKLSSSTEVVKRFESGNSHMNNIKYVHIWDYEGSEREDMAWWEQDSRREAREGMIPQDKQGLKKILQDQQARYRTLVKQLKATRETDKYKAMVDKVDKIMVRFTKFMHKFIADPKWANDVRWKADRIFDSIRKGYDRNARYQEYGVLYAFQTWSKSVVRTLNAENHYSGAPDSTELEEAINRADKNLSEIGM